jgi:uncharacterized protein (DUF427 family)
MTETAENGKPIESVWDYPRPPRIDPVDHLVEVSHLGVTIARSTASLRVLETSQPPAYYIPAADIAMDLLRPSAGMTYCEWKGPASYADVVVTSGGDETVAVSDAAWTYLSPTEPFAALADHWAFYAQKLERCTVDGEVVDPNAGSFYGGWITVNVTGPFKGAPGTGHW